MTERPEHFKRGGALPDTWPKRPGLLRRVWRSYLCPDCGKRGLIHECPAIDGCIRPG